MFKEIGCSRISHLEKLSLDLEVGPEGRGRRKEVTPKDPHLANSFVLLISSQGVDVEIPRGFVTSTPPLPPQMLFPEKWIQDCLHLL